MIFLYLYEISQKIVGAANSTVNALENENQRVYGRNIVSKEQHR